MFLSKKDAVLQDSDQAALWDYFFPPQKWNLNPNFQKKLLLAKISVESLLWVNLKWHVNMGGIKKVSKSYKSQWEFFIGSFHYNLFLRDKVF